MGVSVIPATAGSEAPAGNVGTEGQPQAPQAPAAPAIPPKPGIVPAPHKPEVLSISEAARRAREAITKATADATAQRDASKQTPAAGAQLETPAVETPIETPVGEGAEGTGTGEGEEVAPELMVEVQNPRAGGDPIPIILPDQEVADALRAQLRGALRGEQARAIRDQAQAMREEAEEIALTAQLDPGGLILAHITAPADLDHLFRFIATRPGVLQRCAEWVADRIEQPDTIEAEAERAELAARKRADEMQDVVAQERAINKNARQLRQAAETVAEEWTPREWDDEQRLAFAQIVLQDVRQYARDNRLQLVNPGVVSGLAQRRFKLLGLAPRSANQPAAGSPPGPGTTRPAPSGQPTAAQITAAAAARRGAGAAPPGAGSPTAAIPKPPKGSSIQQAIAHARRFMTGQRPQ